MKPLWIIDGYNMIRRIGSLRAHEVKSLAGGRNALLAKLASFRHRTQADITVVFDGQTMALETKAGIRVVFSNLPNKADAMIKKLVDGENRARAMTVVSSDHEVMVYAKGCGCNVLRSEHFFEKLSSQSGGESETPDVKSDPTLSEKELSYWRDLFNEKP